MEDSTELIHVIPDIRGLQSVDDFSKVIKSAILGGEVDAAKAGIVLKKMNKVSEELLKDKQVKDVILESTERYLGGQKTAVVFGATITRAAVWTGYDFKDCGHPVLNKLVVIQKQVETAIKLLEEELKLMVKEDNTDIVPNSPEFTLEIPDNTKSIIVEKMPDLVWNGDGEVVKVKPPIKRQTIGLKYSKI